jgi:hypothetical protein
MNTEYNDKRKQAKKQKHRNIKQLYPNIFLKETIKINENNGKDSPIIFFNDATIKNITLQEWNDIRRSNKGLNK